MAKKQFKIGECAVGGIIEVNIQDALVHIIARNYFTKRHVQSTAIPIGNTNAERQIDNYLNDLTTSYYAGKVLDWIKTKVNLN